MTEKHIKEVSLGVLFPMDAAKKFDKAMGASPQTTAHTTRDASDDVKKMVTYLRENKVVENRLTPEFIDPTIVAHQTVKLTVNNCGEERENDEIDFDPELSDVVL